MDNFNGEPRITNWVCSTSFSKFVPNDLMHGMGVVDQVLVEEDKELLEEEMVEVPVILELQLLMEQLILAVVEQVIQVRLVQAVQV